MKRRLLAILALLLVAPAGAQPSEIYEDFEGFNTGEAGGTSNAIGVVQEFASSNPCDATIETPGLDSTSRKLRFRNTGNANCALNVHDSIEAITVFSIWLRAVPASTGSAILRFTNAAGSQDLFLFGATQPGGTMSISHGGSTCTTTAAATLFPALTQGTAVKFTFTLNFATNQFTYDVNDGQYTGTKKFAFCQTFQGLKQIHFTPAVEPYFEIDQIIWGGTEIAPPPPPPLEPSEFDAGLTVAIESWGFRSPESKMFFTLIVTGISSVGTGALMKVVPAARWKNWIMGGVPMMFCVFCVFMFFVELWMYFLAMILGITVLQGTKETRNTWLELREHLQGGVETVDDAAAAQGHVEVEEAPDVEPAATEPEAPASDTEQVEEAS